MRYAKRDLVLHLLFFVGDAHDGYNRIALA